MKLWANFDTCACGETQTSTVTLGKNTAKPLKDRMDAVPCTHAHTTWYCPVGTTRPHGHAAPRSRRGRRCVRQVHDDGSAKPVLRLLRFILPRLCFTGPARSEMEAFDEDEDADVMWLGKTKAVDRFDGSCCIKMAKMMKLHDEESRSTMLSKGDHAIAVEWFERVSDDPQRRTFVRGDGIVCFVNSTELRHIVDPSGISERLQGSAKRWHLDRDEENHGEDYCR